MTFDGRLANIAGLIVRSLYIPFTHNLIFKNLHEITVNSQAWLNLFTSVVRSLATPAKGMSLHHLKPVVPLLVFFHF